MRNLKPLMRRVPNRSLPFFSVTNIGHYVNAVFGYRNKKLVSVISEYFIETEICTQCFTCYEQFAVTNR